MRIEKYYCDKCNKEVKSHLRDLTEVKVTVKSHETQELQFYPNETMNICNECLDEVGFNRKTNSIPNPFELIKRIFKR